MSMAGYDVRVLWSRSILYTPYALAHLGHLPRTRTTRHILPIHPVYTEKSVRSSPRPSTAAGVLRSASAKGEDTHQLHVLNRPGVIISVVGLLFPLTNVWEMNRIYSLSSDDFASGGVHRCFVITRLIVV